MSKVIAIALALLTLGLVCSRTTIAQLPNEQPSRGIAHHGWQWAERREDCATIRFSPAVRQMIFPASATGRSPFTDFRR